MQTVLLVGVAAIGGMFLLMVGMNLLVRLKARELEGQPMPDVPGPIGESLSKAGRGLVYFFSPQCGACRAITPRMKALSEKNHSVFVVDITEQLEVARAMHVLATPSTVEIADGKVVGVHVGMPPKDLEARFAT